MSFDRIGKYEVIHKIADGGMGSVYKARDPGTGEVVAVKVIAPNIRNPTLLKRFEQEFRAAAMLDHPNIVRAVEYCADGDAPYLVMEYVDGESLGQRIERDGAMPEEEALAVIGQVCGALGKAHDNGVIHRDIKPENILIDREGRAKLADMGLAKNLLGDQNLTLSGRGLGTLNYMAPEQIRDAKNAGIRYDVYSLGATLYAMVTGEPPFGKLGPLDCWMKKHNNEFPTPRSLRPGLSDRVDWAIRRAMSGEPEKRPATCQEFLDDLTGRSTRPAPAPTPKRATATDARDSGVWYLVYRDETNQQHTVKGNTDAIRRALRDNLLGDVEGIRVGRARQGPFEPLRNIPVFRDLMPPRTPVTFSSLDRSIDPPRRSAGQPPIRQSDGVSPGGPRGTPAAPEPIGTTPRRPPLTVPEKSGYPEWLIWLVVLAVAVGFALAMGLLYR